MSKKHENEIRHFHGLSALLLLTLSLSEHSGHDLVQELNQMHKAEVYGIVIATVWTAQYLCFLCHMAAATVSHRIKKQPTSRPQHSAFQDHDKSPAEFSEH